ncbi:MAG TPA: oxidative damage protection protein [Gemmatimonadales bacterium]|nr:oxidative damage protection protein [Gemmatimonadales bacterium]
MPIVQCARCGQARDGLAFRPFPNELGLRVYENICNACWGEWLRLQQQLINHYALDVRDPRAKEFLFRNMETFLFEGQGS